MGKPETEGKMPVRSVLLTKAVQQGGSEWSPVPWGTWGQRAALESFPNVAQGGGDIYPQSPGAPWLTAASLHIYSGISSTRG